MQKYFKKVACVALLATASSVVLAADKSEPIGVKVGVGFDQGFGVTAQFMDNINVFLGNDGLSADYIVREGAFAPEIPFHWYVGVGGAVNWSSSYDHWHSDGSWHSDDYNRYSARVPLGINFPFATHWNVYGQIAPNLEYSDKQHDNEIKFGVDFALGIRYAF